MGTAKRERQKANKARREQEAVREQTKKRTLRLSLLIGGAIVAVFVIVAVAGRFFLDSEDDGTVVTNDDVATTDLAPTEDEPDIATTDADPATTTVSNGDEDGAATTEPIDDATDAAASTTECPPVEGTEEQTQTFDGPPPFCLDPAVAYSAKVTTTAGEITIDLDQEAAPTAVNNFVFLARNNYFDDTECHRVIQGFVAQCGDPTATGTGGPGYEFADELPGPGQYVIGSIAMANSGPNTNGSQFFIISGDNGAALPPLYSLFGEVSGDGDLEIIAEMDARGSLDSSGVATEELRILDVEIIES